MPKLHLCHLLALSVLAFISLRPQSAGAQNPCEIKNVLGTDQKGNAVPIETYLDVQKGSLTSKIVYGVTNAEFSADDPKYPLGKVTGNLTLSLVLDPNQCPLFRYPLGILFRNASFPVKEPFTVEIAEGKGRANVSFDDARFSATLSEIIPLPPGFSYQVRLIETPVNLNGLKFSVSVVAPGRIGDLFKFDVVLDSNREDFGLFAAALQIGATSGALQAERRSAIQAIATQVKRRIQESVKSKQFDFDHLIATSPTIDWDSWARGDQSFAVSLLWKDIDPIFGPILPSKAELHIDAQGKLRLSFPPVDSEKLRALVASEIAARLPDPSLLDDIAKRFGDIPSKSIPGGWLRIRNLTVTETALFADVAFAITDQAMNWQKLRVDFPAKTSALTPLVSAIAASANATIAEYLKKIAADTAYQAVISYLDDNKNKTLRLFGQDFHVELVKAQGAKLPPVPLIKMSTQTGDIVISNVGLTIQNFTLRYDWTNADIQGVNILADRLLQAAGLQGGGNLSFALGNLQFLNGRLNGVLQGAVWGSPFSAPFSIGEQDTKISLPTLHQQLVTVLQGVLDNKTISAFGLSLSNFKVCPDGPVSGQCANNELATEAKFEAENVFSGVISVRLYPALDFKIVSVQTLPGFAALTNLFQSGAVTIDLPANISPLVLSGTINLANLFNAIPVPPIPFRWSAETRKVTLSFPTVIPIDTDVFIPPWLNLSQVRIPISANPDGSVTVGLRMTLGEHYFQYVFNIDGSLSANPKDSTVSLLGGASLLSIPLYEVDGKLDFPHTNAAATSHTKGLLKAIIQQEGQLHISGQECLVSQRDTIRFLFFKFDSDLLIQIPAAACNRPLSKQAADCGIPSSGGLCIKANASAGALGNADARLLADLNLQFVVSANTSINLLGQGVDLALEGSEKMLRVKAKALGMKFGFSIANPNQSSDRVIKDLLEAIIRQLLNPKITIPGPISVTSRDGSTVKVDVENDNGSDPSTPAVTKGSTAAAGDKAAAPEQPAEGTKEAAQKNKQKQAPPPPDTKKQGLPNKETPTVVAKGASEVQPFESGPILVSLDQQDFITQTDKDSGASRKSASPVHRSAIPVLTAGCKVYAWFTRVVGSGRAEPADADGAILVTSGCPAPSKCTADQLCAFPLRSSEAGQITAANVAPNIKWLTLTEIVTKKAKAGAIASKIILETARAQSLAAQPQLPLGGEWRCLELKQEDCSLALEMDVPNGGRAFGSERAGILPLQPNSFLYWSAEQNDDAFKRDIFSAADAGVLAVYGRSGSGWLIDGGSAPQAKGVGVLTKSKLKFIPVLFTGTTKPVSHSGFSGDFEPDAPLEASIDIIAQDASVVDMHWQLNSIVSEEGRRVLLSSDNELYLFSKSESPGKPLAKKRALADVGNGPNLCFETAVKTPEEKVSKISDLLNLTAAQWRARGLRINPVLLIFDQACSG